MVSRRARHAGRFSYGLRSQSANCSKTSVKTVHFRERSDYIVDLSDGHSYQRDPQGTDSYVGGVLQKFSAGDTAYVCTKIGGDPNGELDVVSSPYEFDYPGTWIFHRIR